MRTQRDQLTMSPLLQRLMVCLDVDGILHSTAVSDQLEALLPYEQEQHRVDIVQGDVHPRDWGMLVPEKQALLAEILRRHPHVVLVVSSAWRNWRNHNIWDRFGADDVAYKADDGGNLEWFKSLLHPVLAERIIGATPALWLQSGADWDQRPSRLDEIRAYMHEHAQDAGLAPNWIAIDDQARHFAALEAGVFHDEAEVRSHPGPFPAEAVLLVNGEVGLTEASAAALDAALLRASSSLRPDATE